MTVTTSWEKWWAATGEEWFKRMELTTVKDIAAAAFGAGHAAGETTQVPTKR